MAKLIRCPKCQSQIDVTAVPGGATVRCADCDALVRVPTGSTGVYPKVGAATAAPAASKGDTRTRTAGGGRQTDIFKKMAGARSPGGSKAPSRSSVDAEMRGGTRIRSKSNNTPLIAGLSIAGVVVLGVLLSLQLGNQKKSKEAAIISATEKNAKIRKQNEETMRLARERDLADEEEAKREEAAAKAAQKAGGAAIKKKAGGGYDVPTTFEPGARKQAKGGFADIPTDPSLTKEYEAMAAAGRSADIVKDIAKWMPYVVMGMVSDTESVARGSYQALQEFCNVKGIKTESGANPVKMDFFNSSYARGQEFTFWRDWWDKPQNRVAIGAGNAKDLEEIRTSPKGSGEDPEKMNWDDAMKLLRAGGGFDDPKRPEGQTFIRVKNMGPRAYPYLIKFIEHEDLALAKAAVTVLNTLTNRQGTMPTEATKTQIKTEWENWVKNN